MNICLISSYTSQLMKNILEEKFRKDNVDTTVAISEYNIIHDLISDDSLLYQSSFDIAVLLFLADDIKNLEELFDCLKTCRAKFKGTLLVANFIAPTVSSLYECNQAEDRLTRFARSQAALKEFLRRELRSNTYLLDFNSMAAKMGADQFFDKRLWYAFQIPFSQKGMDAVAQLVFRAVHCLVHPRKKCIVLDCDNTLWGGIIGEDGLEGIKLGPTYPGNCYMEFQKQLLELKKIGYILAINSKNNEPDVLAVLDQHPSQILKGTDFVAKKINWHNKVENFLELSRELNLGLDAFVFFDDNPAELQLINDHLPAITTIPVPKDNPVKIVSLIEDNYLSLDIIKIVAEDKAKTEMYLANIARDELKKSAINITDYYQSLDMKMEVRKNSKINIPRFSQMTLKTNQFNVITLRRTEAEIASLLERKGVCLYCFKLEDKFGDNGIVGYCEVEIDETQANLLNFLMSCRVIGRNAENEFLTQILLDLKGQGITTVSANWIKSPKNAICENFFDNYGFNLIDHDQDHKTYQVYLDQIRLTPLDYFRVLWQTTSL
jgi:FkbH-like protein